MSNHVKAGTDAVRVQDRHGRKGHVALTTTVPPVLKNHLVELCEHRGVTLKAAIQEALEAYLYRVDNTDRERWYGG
jgi:hypothetical protein